MITLALLVTGGVLFVLLPCYACARYLEWCEWDSDRRIERLRVRRLLK